MAITPKKLERYFKLKLAAETGPHGLKGLLDKKAKITVVDVRRPEDYKGGHIPGAVNIPQAELEKRYKKISRKTQVCVYCYDVTCFSAPQAALFLAKKGYFVTELIGGYAAYKAAGFPVETAKAAKPSKAEAHPEPAKPEPVAA